jgi:hypothetical protein
MALKMTSAQRMNQHIHNGLLGRYKMALAAMRAIAESQTTTPETRAEAYAALAHMEKLPDLLEWRVNADSTITKVKHKVLCEVDIPF